MKTEKFRAFTLPELLTVVAIIAILIGVLMPALSQVKRIAKEAKQKAQIGSIEMAIIAYKLEIGAYPPSHGSNAPAYGIDSDYYRYGGAQTLAEAMFGQDLLGFSPDSNYTNEGINNTISETPAARHYIYTGELAADRDASLSKRKGPYLDRANISVFKPSDVFGEDTYTASYFVVSDRYVICDVFASVNRSIGGKNYKIGTPLLYFRANPSPEYQELTFSAAASEHTKNIYNWRDNYYLMRLKSVAKSIAYGKEHPLCPIVSDATKAQSGELFYGFIGDPMVSPLRRPVRPDSFLLISAGSDGLYGTKDDICNFDPNLP